MLLRRHWWTVSAGVVISAYGLAALYVPAGYSLTAFGDISLLLLTLLGVVLMAGNAVSSRGQNRVFWLLMGSSCLLWAVSTGGWTLIEVIQRRPLPDPFIGDIVLFVHVVPFMAAVALRPHRPQEHKKLYFSTLNFLMLLIWWVFLYAFTVFPDEYVILNAPVYSRNYDLLYLVENLVLLTALGWLMASAQGDWKRIYRNLFISAALYTWGSEAINTAIARGQYYTGSWYDIPLIASICWMIAAALMSRDLKPECDRAPSHTSKWPALSPRLAMMAILSLPFTAFWCQFFDTSAPTIRRFRMLVSLSTMLVLGIFMFLRQYLVDQQLVRLLKQSRQSFENLQRLQAQLVQKEKLASLGHLVAGAAHEINNPVAAILGYSELLAGDHALEPTQVTMARKIGEQARRTRDLVSGLLSFSQHSPAAKTLVDAGSVLKRSLQMKLLQLESKGIRVEIKIAANLPPIWGNSNQLMQCCLEIISNAMDALEDSGGGTLSVSAQRSHDEIVIEFADSGPGILEPDHVFDPFYTTKPIGKGTGLGLSAAYGIVQDHHGQISCHNRGENGAAFTFRFPVADLGSSAPCAKDAAPIAVQD